jgi:hypothetical protein
MGCLSVLIAGPKIMLLFPIWLMGWAAYSERLSKRFPKWLSLALFAQPVAFLVFYDRFGLSHWGQAILERAMGHDMWHDGLVWSRYVISDTLLGLSITLHLLGAKGLGDNLLPLLQRFAKPIKQFAGQSFTLYLLHQPALLCIGALLAAQPLGGARGAVVAILALAMISVVASVTEGQKHRIKPAIAWLVGRSRKIIESWPGQAGSGTLIAGQSGHP